MRGSLPDRARAVVCVEAKAGEDLGTTIAAQRVEAERAKAANPRSNATARLDGLLRRFVSPDHPPEETDRLRYQLLTALAGTIAEASAIGAAHAVLMLHDFRTDERRDDLASEHDDQLRAFARAVFGVDTPPRGSVPWCVHLGSVAEAPTLELYLAWAVTDLSSSAVLRRGAMPAPTRSPARPPARCRRACRRARSGTRGAWHRVVAVRRDELDGVTDGRRAARPVRSIRPRSSPPMRRPSRPARPSRPRGEPRPVPTSSLSPASVMTKPGWALEQRSPARTATARTDGAHRLAARRRGS